MPRSALLIFVFIFMIAVGEYGKASEPDCKQSPLKCNDLIQNHWNWMNAYTIPRNCFLGIISAGTPRSGSTLVTNMLDYIVKQVFPPSDYEHYNTYWNYHFHMEGQMNESARQQIFQAHQDAMKQVKENFVIIAKSHEAQGSLMKLCKNTILVTTTRSLCETVASAVQAKWFDYNGPLAVDFMTQTIAQHECWLCQASRNQNIKIIPTKYAEILQKPVKLFAQFLTAVSELEIPVQAVKELSFTQILSQDANPWIPGSKFDVRGRKSKELTLNPPEYVIRWQRKENYSNECFSKTQIRGTALYPKIRHR